MSDDNELHSGLPWLAFSLPALLVVGAIGGLYALIMGVLHLTGIVKPPRPPEIQPIQHVVVIADVAVTRREHRPFRAAVSFIEELESRTFADTALAAVRSILSERGLQVDTTYMASTGAALGGGSYRLRTVSGSLRQDGPPFFLVSPVGDTEASRRQWLTAQHTIDTYRSARKVDAAASHGVASLSRELAAGGIMVLRVVSLSEPLGSRFWGGCLSNPQYGSIDFTVFSGQDGSILWDHHEYWDGTPMKLENVRANVNWLMKGFPRLAARPMSSVYPVSRLPADVAATPPLEVSAGR